MLDQAFNNPVLILGLASEVSGSRSISSISVNGAALTTTGVGGRADGQGFSFLNWGSPGALAAGTQSISVAISGGTAPLGSVLWVVDGISTNASDSAYSAWRDNENGGDGTGGTNGALGFNLTVPGLNPMAAVDTGTRDTNFAPASGDLLFSFVMTGIDGTRFSGVRGASLSSNDLNNVLASGGSGYSAAWGAAISNSPEIGFNANNGYFRAVMTSVSFTIPEPTSVSLLAVTGLLALAGAARRRR